MQFLAANSLTPVPSDLSPQKSYCNQIAGSMLSMIERHQNIELHSWLRMRLYRVPSASEAQSS